jgi:carbamoyl-phosphate synthase large subunit
MPRRDDIETILILGSGPIVIGQACEFDYSGTQAVRALRAEGYRVLVVNSNPASFMTDPRLAHRTYVEPITAEVVARIIARERPDALLPTLGGQTALNVAVELAENGVLERYRVELLGADVDTIRTAEDRSLFEDAMQGIGLLTPRGSFASTVEEAREIAKELGFPVVLRPSFTLGGSGGAVAYDLEELDSAADWALRCSPTCEVLVEESLIGWKEFELEVMRDGADNCVIVCSIENVDPMGIHTGDSVTVAPAMTLSDPEYQAMRNDALAAIRVLGLRTGGCNIQFAVDPATGERRVIEVNPRVSRSSALASKATGFAIAKIAAKLAVGYTLDELRNEITGATPASFEPSLDYVVVKIPRFAFEKFPGAEARLGTQMKSVGEVMAIGRTFLEALGKAMRSLEDGSVPTAEVLAESSSEELEYQIRENHPHRLPILLEALRRGVSVERLHELCAIDPWFLHELQERVEIERGIVDRYQDSAHLPDRDELLEAKRAGISDADLAALCQLAEWEIAMQRRSLGVRPVYKVVDSCAAEFEARTPYLYSTYEEEDEAPPSSKKKVIVLGSGPNRIGQGLEFDTCCVEAMLALREEGLEAIMVNCNPETVSTDYDISQRLYFEPVSFEEVSAILERERPDGVIVTLGGQTPLKLAHALASAGAPMWGTRPEDIDRAEDREKFHALCTALGLKLPDGAMATSAAQAFAAAESLGYPILLRPSYVLGGRAMAICEDEEQLRRAVFGMMTPSGEPLYGSGRPLLLDRFLSGALELDVDLLCDGKRAVVCGIMEHIERAGVHSGDSSCLLPPLGTSPELQERVRDAACRLALALHVRGPMNAQFAVLDDELYVLEANPRASRSLPFVSRATGLPLAAMAAKIMAGRSLDELELFESPKPRHVSVKACSFPFHKFPGSDVHLGPEMRSTGESMGVASRFGPAFAKALAGVGQSLPDAGRVYVSAGESEWMALLPVAKRLSDLRFLLVADARTAARLEERGLRVDELAEGPNFHHELLRRLNGGELQMILVAPGGVRNREADSALRRQCMVRGVPFLPTVEAGMAAAVAIFEMSHRTEDVRCLQELYQPAEPEREAEAVREQLAMRHSA